MDSWYKLDKLFNSDLAYILLVFAQNIFGYLLACHNLRVDQRRYKNNHDKQKVLLSISWHSYEWQFKTERASKHSANRLRRTVLLSKKVLNVTKLTIIYHALINSVLSYGIVGWGSVYNNVIYPVQTLQNKVLQLVFNKMLDIAQESYIKNFHNQTTVCHILNQNMYQTFTSFKQRSKNANNHGTNLLHLRGLLEF